MIMHARNGKPFILPHWRQPLETWPCRNTAEEIGTCGCVDCVVTRVAWETEREGRWYRRAWRWLKNKSCHLLGHREQMRIDWITFRADHFCGRCGLRLSR
jgi:hypothetical protein